MFSSSTIQMSAISLSFLLNWATFYKKLYKLEIMQLSIFWQQLLLS